MALRNCEFITGFCSKFQSLRSFLSEIYVINLAKFDTKQYGGGWKTPGRG